ncbi:hypothetical protein M9Y10_039847 [Tritrichomonas musculus]|uniref:Protein kinase domain-containing protein n=1 Tax=Tritrichomonas musculus TaxID=1915356 RepID=A0ABR2GQJ5_9EUKA
MGNSKCLNTININDYELSNLIVNDVYYQIFKIVEKNTSQTFSAKIYTEPDTNDDSSKDSISLLKYFSNEVDILRTINSPFIIKCIGINHIGFRDKPGYVVITEYMSNGTLEDLRFKKSNLSDNVLNETNKLIIIFGIASGMVNIHENNIILRFLNPENIFLDDHLFPKIANFEYATTSNKTDDLEEISMHLRVGGQKFISPEILNEETYDQSADIYSFGILLYYIITGELPKIKLRQVLKGEKIPLKENIPQAYKNLIYRCTSFNQKERPNIKEIVSLLKTDKSFITEEIDEEQFLQFIKSIENQEEELNFNFKKVHIEYPNEFLIEIDPIDLSLFEKQDLIGKGQFGEVYKIKEKKTSEISAAKINQLEIEEIKPTEMQNLVNEISILSKINSITILKFIGYNEKNFEDKSRPTIITEFCKNDSLEKIIELQENGLSPPEWDNTKMLITAYGIASGMSHLHSKNILHRDLKPGNVFFDKYLFPKIGDFGLSTEILDDSPIFEFIHKGTPAFMAPEIISDYCYSKASDVYAYSILLYQMITLKKPYEGFSFFQLIRNVPKGIRPQFIDDVPSCFRKLIERCWNNDPDKRPTFDEIVHLLENDTEFITDLVDSTEYYKYIDYIKSNQITDDFKQVTIDYSELKRIQLRLKRLNIPYIELNKFTKHRLIKKIDSFNLYKIKSKENNEIYEAKISTFDITKISTKNMIHLSREINILTKLKHPSFLKFIGYSPIDFDKQLNPTIVTEMPPNKSLEQLLNAKRNDENISEFDDTKKLIIIYGIASGMSFLHLYNVIHRNLSPESIFLDEHLFPKIGNFALLRQIHSVESMTFQTTIGIKGNPSYLSPEILEKNEYSKCSDVYAFGMIVYEIMTLEIPNNSFKSTNNSNSLFNEIIINSSRPKIDSNIPEKYRQLIEKCWSQDPNERPTFEGISSSLKSDPGFLANNVDKDAFLQYVRYIEGSDIFFYSKKQNVKCNDLIDAKILIKNEEINQENDTKSIIIKLDRNQFNKYGKHIDTINQYISERNSSNLIQFLHKNNDNNFTNTVIDKIYNNDRQFYISLIKDGASIKNPVCLHKLAISLIFNNNSSKDMNDCKEACRLLDMSINDGFILSHFIKARLFYEIFKENKISYQIAKEGSEKGDKYCACLLGYFTMRGVGVQKDFDLGVSMMIDSGCERFYKIFSTEIAINYSKQNDEKKSFKWFQIAFNYQKTSASINNFGVCYLKGYGVTKKYPKSRRDFCSWSFKK